MASTTLTVVTATIGGATITAKTSVASSETLTIQPSTAQSLLDFSSLHIRVTNTSTTASVTLSLGATTEYSDSDVGAYTVTVATDASVIVGGHDFEGSRFLTTSKTIVFTQTGTGPTSWEAYQAPNAWE